MTAIKFGASGSVVSVILAVVLVAVPDRRAKAEIQQLLDTRAEQIWKQQDACVAASVSQFPDQDLVSLRRRDRSVDTCLKDHELPPRAHLVPDP